MFTGLVQAVGIILKITKQTGADGASFVSRIGVFIKHEKFDFKNIKIGDSVAINGCCLTVISIDFDHFTLYFDVSRETFNKTTFAIFSEGMEVNLELAIKSGEYLGGHIVSGHIDQVGKLVELAKHDNEWTMAFQVSPWHKELLVEKGSITVEGISLTINRVKFSRFWVAIIPHTWQNTTLKNLDTTYKNIVNIEFDQIGKYVQKYMKNYQEQQNKKS
jgi:riboflavin synthase